MPSEFTENWVKLLLANGNANPMLCTDEYLLSAVPDTSRLVLSVTVIHMLSSTPVEYV